MKKISILFFTLIASFLSCKDEEISICGDKNKNYAFFSKHSGTVWYTNLGGAEFYYRINQDSFDDYYIDKCFNYPSADCEYDNKGGVVSGMFFEGEKYTKKLLLDEPNLISFKLESGSYNGIISYTMNDTGDTLTYLLEDNVSYDKGMMLTKTSDPFPNITCE